MQSWPSKPSLIHNPFKRNFMSRLQILKIKFTDLWQHNSSHLAFTKLCPILFLYFCVDMKRTVFFLTLRRKMAFMIDWFTNFICLFHFRITISLIWWEISFFCLNRGLFFILFDRRSMKFDSFLLSINFGKWIICLSADGVWKSSSHLSYLRLKNINFESFYYFRFELLLLYLHDKLY